MRLFIIGALVSISPPTICAQESWCRYQPGSFAAIEQQHRADVNDTLPVGHRAWVFNAEFRGVRVPVVYMGATRPLADVDSTFLDGYLYRVLPDSAYRALFHKEVRFVSGRDTLWLATQDSLIPDLTKEAQPGDSVTLFVSWLGMHQEGPVVTWVFAVKGIVLTRVGVALY